jgi:hypothetical protein
MSTSKRDLKETATAMDAVVQLSDGKGEHEVPRPKTQWFSLHLQLRSTPRIGNLKGPSYPSARTKRSMMRGTGDSFGLDFSTSFMLNIFNALLSAQWLHYSIP